VKSIFFIITAFTVFSLSGQAAIAGVFSGITKCQRLGEGSVLEFYGDCDYEGGGNMHGSTVDITVPVTVNQGQFDNEYDAVRSIEIRLSRQIDDKGVVTENHSFKDVDGRVYKIYSREDVNQLGFDWEWENKPIVMNSYSEVVHPQYGTFRWDNQ